MLSEDHVHNTNIFRPATLCRAHLTQCYLTQFNLTQCNLTQCTMHVASAIVIRHLLSRKLHLLRFVTASEIGPRKVVWLTYLIEPAVVRTMHKENQFESTPYDWTIRAKSYTVV